MAINTQSRMATSTALVVLMVISRGLSLHHGHAPPPSRYQPHYHQNVVQNGHSRPWNSPPRRRGRRRRRGTPLLEAKFRDGDAGEEDGEDDGRAEVFDLEEDAVDLVGGARAIRSAQEAARAAMASKFGGLVIRIDDLSWVAASVRLESSSAPAPSLRRRCATSNIRAAADMVPNLPTGLEYLFIGGVAKNAKRVLGFAARQKMSVVLRSIDDATQLEESIVKAAERGSKKRAEQEAAASSRKRKGKGGGDKTVRSLDVYLSAEALLTEGSGAHLVEKCPHLSFRGCWFEGVPQAVHALGEPAGGRAAAMGLLAPGSSLELLLPATSIGSVGELLDGDAAAAVGTVSFVYDEAGEPPQPQKIGEKRSQEK